MMWRSKPAILSPPTWRHGPVFSRYFNSSSANIPTWKMAELQRVCLAQGCERRATLGLRQRGNINLERILSAVRPPLAQARGATVGQDHRGPEHAFQTANER